MALASVIVCAIFREDTKELLELVEPMEVTFTMSKEKTPKYGIGRDRTARGIISGNETVEGSFTSARRIAPDIEWQKWWHDNVPFSCIRSLGDGGTRYAFMGCEISQVEESHSAEGSDGIEESIDFVGRKFRDLSIL